MNFRKNHHLKSTFLLSLLTAILLPIVHAEPKYNVLFIAIDDLRPELGAYGSEHIKSPNIDKLASEGTLFERAYCSVPTCGASRASLFTSVYPTSERFFNYNDEAGIQAPAAQTLPEIFKKAGYTTVSNGKVFHNPADTAERSWSRPPWKEEGPGRNGLTKGRKVPADRPAREKGFMFDWAEAPDNAYPDGKIAERTIADLRKFKESGEPFFLACGFQKPHMPFHAPKKYWDLYDREKIEIADNRYRPKDAPKDLPQRGSGEPGTYYANGYDIYSKEGHQVMRHGYYACVSYVDKLTGDVLAELARLGLDKNTIIVLWGDHGWHLGEHNFWSKHNTMHNAMRIPFIVKIPGKAGGSKVNTFIESIDIYPTLTEMTGIHAPDTVQGQSFATLFDNPQQAHRDHIYCRFKPADAVVNENFAYTLFVTGNEMLYDHRKDPEENINVAGNPEYKEVIEKMRTLVQKKITLAESAKVN